MRNQKKGQKKGQIPLVSLEIFEGDERVAWEEDGVEAGQSIHAIAFLVQGLVREGDTVQYGAQRLGVHGLGLVPLKER